MKVYVATKWENRVRAKYVMQWLRENGHQVTFDWTVSDQESVEGATSDMMGVLQSEIMVVLAEDDYAFRGTYVEFGMAVAAGLPVIIVGPYFQNIFDKMSQVSRVKLLADALHIINNQMS